MVCPKSLWLLEGIYFLVFESFFCRRIYRHVFISFALEPSLPDTAYQKKSNRDYCLIIHFTLSEAAFLVTVTNSRYKLTLGIITGQMTKHVETSQNCPEEYTHKVYVIMVEIICRCSLFERVNVFPGLVTRGIHLKYLVLCF